MSETMDARHLRYVFGEGIKVPGLETKTNWEVVLEGAGGRLGHEEYVEKFLYRVPKFQTNTELVNFERAIHHIITGPGNNPEFKQNISLFTTWAQLEKFIFPVLEMYPVQSNTPPILLDDITEPSITDIMNLPIYKNLNFDSTKRTFQYIFNKTKCGIFVAIRNGKLAIFCPFSNSKFEQKWGNELQISAALKAELDNKAKVPEKVWEKNTSKRDYKEHTYKREPLYLPKSFWWTNGGTLGNVRQLGEWSDEYFLELHEHVSETCAKHKIPDCDFFLNKRDYPQFTYKREASRLMEPYPFLYHKDEMDLKVVPSKAYKDSSCFAPVASFYSSSTDFADLLLPLMEDYSSSIPEKIPSLHGVRTKTNYFGIQPIPFKDRTIHKACFRGSATGAGITPADNQRLRLAQLSFMEEQTTDLGQRLLDAKLTSENIRHKKTTDITKPASFLNIPEMMKIERPNGEAPWIIASKPDGTPADTFTQEWDDWYFRSLFYVSDRDVNNAQLIYLRNNFIDMAEQRLYRYVIYVEGHSAANRFGQLLAMGAVILRVKSKCLPKDIWFFSKLVENVHYVNVADDLSDIFTVIQGLNEAPEKGEFISNEARKFYDTYLTHEAILDYTASMLKAISSKTQYTTPNKVMDEAVAPMEVDEADNVPVPVAQGEVANPIQRSEFGVTTAHPVTLPEASKKKDYATMAAKCIKKNKHKGGRRK